MSDADVARFSNELLEGLIGRVGESAVAEHDLAVEQIEDYLKTHPLVMQKAIMKYGLAGGPDGSADDSDDQTD